MPAGEPQQRRALRCLLIGGFFVVATVAFFDSTVFGGETFSTVGAVQRVYFPWQATHENGLPFFPQSDQAQTFHPRQVFLDRTLDDGELPAWDPYTFSGHPYLSNGANSFFYPPRQAITWATGPVIAHDLFLMFHMALAGVAAYFLLRTLGASTAGGLLGGLAWMWNPFALAWAQLELLPAIVAWLPLGLALVYRAHHRQSWPDRLGAGACCGMMLLGGSLDLATTACGVVFLYAAALEAARWWGDRRVAAIPAAVGRLASIGAVAFGLGAPALVPFALLSARFARQPLDYDTFVSSVTVPLSTFARFWWRPDFPFTDVTMHRMAFVGTPIAVLAVVGVFQRRPGTGLARGLLLGSVLFLGRTPFVAVFDALFASYRFLSLGRFMFAWALGLVILAVVGFDRLVARVAAARPDRRQVMAAATCVVLVVASGAQLRRYGQAINAAPIPREPSFLFPETPLIEAVLDRQEGPAADRNLPLLRPGRQPLPDSSIPLVFPFESAAGYESSLPSSIADLTRVLGGETVEEVLARDLTSGLVALFFTDRTRFDLLPRLGITSVLGPPDLADEPGWTEAEREARGLTTTYEGIDGILMEVEGAAPRAFVVHDTEVAASQDEALERFVEPDFPWSTAVLLTEGSGDDGDHGEGAGSAGAADEPPEAAEVRRHGLTTVEVAVDTDAPGHLVLLDSYDEGWSATVDGEAVEVLQADVTYRAVPVPAGRSTVVFRYRTPGLGLGLAIGAATVVIASTAAFAAYRRRDDDAIPVEPTREALSEA